MSCVLLKKTGLTKENKKHCTREHNTQRDKKRDETRQVKRDEPSARTHIKCGNEMKRKQQQKTISYRRRTRCGWKERKDKSTDDGLEANAMNA